MQPIHASSETTQSEGFARVDEVVGYVSDAFDEAGVELEVYYFLGEVSDAVGEPLVSTSLATPRGRAFLVCDGFDSCWLVLHKSGTTGTIRRCDESISSALISEQCCEFLGLPKG